MIQSPTWKQAGSGRGGDNPENSGRAAKGALDGDNESRIVMQDIEGNEFCLD